MKTHVYNQKGESVKEITLPESIFGLSWNADLVHQVITAMNTNARKSTAHTKTRGEVSGTGMKPWKQKGTGRARHGSRRSPIWVKGGVAHGPRSDKNYERKVNKKVKTKALYTILARKWKDNEIIFVDSLSFAKPSTKEALSFMKGLSANKDFATLATKKVNAALVMAPAMETAAARSFSNIKSVDFDLVSNLNPVTAAKYKFLIITNPDAALKTLEAKKK